MIKIYPPKCNSARHLIKFAIIASPVFLSNCQPGSQNKTEKPNIIFILTDDQRWDALGYEGNKLIQTPEMDKLAKSGTYFNHGIVTTPICAASRASILTGLHERTHRFTFQTGPVREEYMSESYPSILLKSGYYTGFFGKSGIKYDNFDKLFNVCEDYDRNGKYKDYRGYFYKTLNGDTVHLTRYTGEKALDFIKTAPKDQPFCLSLSFSAPHAHDPAPEQYFWQKESDRLYKDIVMPGPELADDSFFNSLPLFVQKGENRTRWHWRYDTPEKYQHSVKGYYRMISEIDSEIGKIRAQLKQQKLDKNTVIIFMGDNGYFIGERQLAGKWLMYDNSIRVPLIVYDPRVKKHRDIDVMALNIDVSATILDLAGVKMPERWQGKSLLPIVSGKINSLERDTILVEHLWETPIIPPSEGVRTTEWKYLRYINNKSFEELYNLKEDPKEINNLAKSAEFFNKLVELRGKCDQLIKENKDQYTIVPGNLSVSFTTAGKIKVPVFGWTLPETPLVYQILASSNKENINNNIGDLWDSGLQNYSETLQVRYQGKTLLPNTTYFWKVRIRDQQNFLSEYSEAQDFTMKGK